MIRNKADDTWIIIDHSYTSLDQISRLVSSTKFRAVMHIAESDYVPQILTLKMQENKGILNPQYDWTSLGSQQTNLLSSKIWTSSN